MNIEWNHLGKKGLLFIVGVVVMLWLFIQPAFHFVILWLFMGVLGLYFGGIDVRDRDAFIDKKIQEGVARQLAEAGLKTPGFTVIEPKSNEKSTTLSPSDN
jgi:hypothetical protein